MTEAVGAAFADAARRWERIIGAIRGAMCLVMFGRSAVIWNWSSPQEHTRAWLTLPMCAVAALYVGGSVAVAHSRTARRVPIDRLLKISVSLDTAYACASLLPNVLWPFPGYSGLINTPDVAALTLATLAAGLRLSPGAAVLGGTLNAAGLAALLGLDVAISNLPAPQVRGFQYVLQGTFLVAAAAISIIIALRTRHLLERAVRAALVAERVQQSFGAILHEHHDVRTLVSAARINADRLADGAGPASLGGVVRDLRSDLDDVEARLNAIRARAYGEVVALEARRAVEIGEVAGDVLGRVARRFPAVTLALRTESQTEGRIEARIAGGAATLRRMLFNLVVNACEGDGVRGAARVDVVVRRDLAGRSVHIEVLDDGPGFPPEVLASALGETRSTKPGGSGFGLGIALALARANDGVLTRGNGAAGGAAVSLSLPMA